MKLTLYFFISLLVLSCKPSFKETEISLDDYKIEENFDLKVIAAEPLLKAPVCIDFDSRGRIWVVEMPGFMNTLEGDTEYEPTGSIKILEDLDNDGVMDHAKVFKDSLVLPRAIAMVYGGVLYSEPPNLWFAEIENDQPKNLVLVDSLYATDGNPEHQPNGLMLNIDNWIYNAKSHYRYQRKNGKWLKETTSFRGQWGITHDDFGRLYYNDNSRQLLGDYMLPNRIINNEFLVPKYSVNQMLTKNQKVYPLHDAIVNRGYAKGVLNKDSLLVNVTAACGPLFYKGGAFTQEYKNEVFVCIPEANLIKRNTLEFHGDSTSAKQTWDDKEFLASTDEGFRPVSLSNASDGSIYVVDMHRGVIGHHAYLSPYMKKKAKERQLDTLVNAGRILKITHKQNQNLETRDLASMSDDELLQGLKSSNGWIRDRTQHRIIYKKLKNLRPGLELLANDIKNPLAQVHALYTLKGLEELSFEILLEVATKSNSDVTSHALVLLEDFLIKDNITPVHKLFSNLLTENDTQLDLYLSTSIGKWATLSTETFYPIIFKLANRHRENKIINEAILSGLDSMKELADNAKINPDRLNENLITGLNRSIELKSQNKPNWIYTKNSLTEDTRTKGAKLFRQICAACHGINGDGLEGVAPPLKKSEYASKPLERMGLIILHGLEGPVHVNGKEYNLNAPMPGLLRNETISNKDIVDIISYVSNAFSDNPSQLKEGDIEKLREMKSKNDKEYTEQELKNHFK